MNRFTTVVAVFIIFFSCTSKNNDKETIKKTEQEKERISEPVAIKDEYDCAPSGETNTDKINGIEIDNF